MCRHLAYLGPPLPLSTLLFDSPHALAHQSWAPRDMRGGGTINADGFGVGWYVPTQPGPLRYRRSRPIWADPALPALAAATHATAMLAAVRSATPGTPLVETACAPFTADDWLFSHNGVISGWPHSVAELAGHLPPADLLTMDAPTDSALLWALVRHRLRDGAGPAGAVASTVADVIAVAPGSRLNLLLTDSHTIVASTAGHALALRTGDGSVLVSSEPLDEVGWQQVPDGVLVVAGRRGVELSPLAVPSPPAAPPAPSSPAFPSPAPSSPAFPSLASPSPASPRRQEYRS